MDIWGRHNLIYRILAIVVIVLHLVTFGPGHEALAFYAESTNYKLSQAQLTQGSGLNRAGNLNLVKVTNDITGEPFASGQLSSTNYKLVSGLAALTKTDPPEFINGPIPYQSWQINQAKPNAFDLDTYFKSPDNLNLKYNVTYLNSNHQINVAIDAQTHQVSFSQVNGWSGVERIKFCAIDSEGNSKESNIVSLQVVSYSSPNKPAITSIEISDPLGMINEGNTIHLIIKAVDPQGGNVTFSYSSLFTPEALPHANPQNIDGVWVAWAQYQNASVGAHDVTISASNGSGKVDTESFSFKVGSVNHPPVLGPISDITVAEGRIADLETKITASDPDNDVVRRYYPAPFDATGRWTPGYDDAGEHNFTLSVSDGTEAVSRNFKVIVTNVNRPPNAPDLRLSRYTVKPNESIDVNVIVSDPDKEDSSLKVSLKLDGNEISPPTPVANNGTFHFDLNLQNFGYYKVKAIVTDLSGVSSEVEQSVQVAEPNPEVSPVMGDFDGNSLTDLGIFDSTKGIWEISLSKKTSELRQQQFYGASLWLENSIFKSRDCWPIGGDFNGDSKSDVGVYNTSNHTLKIALSNGRDKFVISDTFNPDLSFASPSWQPFTGNFNGDKYTDLAFYNRDDGTVKVFLGRADGFDGPFQAKTKFPANYVAMGGDFNADALTDLCLFKKDSGEIKVYFSNSFAYRNGEDDFIDGVNFGYSAAKDKDILLSDFNNDGLADLGYWDKDTYKWYCVSGTGSAFTDNKVWLENFGASTDQSATTGDFNGDGITDPATFNKEKIGIERWTTPRAFSGEPGDFLMWINNGVGGLTRIDYTYAADQANNDNLPFPVYVVSGTSSQSTTPVIQTYGQNFTFTGGYYDPDEREFRGFAKATVTDRITGNYTETEFWQGLPGEDGALKGQIKKITAYLQEDNDGSITTRRVSQTTNHYIVKKGGPLDRNLGFPSLDNQETIIFEDDNTRLRTVDSYTYDNVGNVLAETTQPEGADLKATTTTYAQAYTVGFNRALETALKDKTGQVVTKKKFEYDDKGNLFRELVDIINPLKDNQVQTAINQYFYDTFGNVTSSTNALGNTVSTEYETDFHTFPKKSTNSLRHTIQYTYDPNFGAVTEVTDTNGQISRTDYDSLGRVIRVKRVVNGREVVATRYAYTTFDKDKGMLNTKTTTNALNLAATEYYDGLGRKYKTESPGENNGLPAKVVSETSFNNRGFVESESLLHYESEAADKFVKYKYDSRGRVIETLSDFPGTAKDTKTTIKYWNSLKTEAIDPYQNSKITIKDLYGNITQVIESGPHILYTTNYKYDIQNNLIETADSSSAHNRTQITYDSVGRKIKMIDPDMGEWNYEYDLGGNLTRQIDAKGQIIEFRYDELNRLIEKRKQSPGETISEIPVTYQYDRPPADNPNQLNCVGRLSKVSDQSGSTEFSYDELGREIRSVKNIGSESYLVERTYDDLDRLTSLKYPDGEIVKYTYDLNSGLLEKVAGQQTYVDDIAYNAKGQINTIAYGNGTHTTYSYGNDLRLSRIFTTSSSQPSVLQDLVYDFDLNGNVTQITDNSSRGRGNTRIYTYDPLNRLIKAENIPDPLSDNGYATFGYEYDSIGNMTKQTKANGSGAGLGEMTYGQNAGPHALTSAGGVNYRYDSNGNMIQGKNKVMAYDVENRLIRVDETRDDGNNYLTTFVYDGDGGRVQKSEHTAQNAERTTQYIGSLYEVNSDGKITKHIFAGSNRVCSRSVSLRGASDEAILYYHSDHLGSSNVISDSAGRLAQYCEYTPYGVTARNEGRDLVSHKFTGKELDSTNLYYYGARYYDPEIGRFITADTIVQAPYDPQSLNRYSYCSNNPINYTDPTGHSWFSKFFKNLGKAIAGNPGAFIAGIAIGIFTAWAIAPMISALSGAMAASGTGITFGEGFILGGLEMGIPAFTGTLAGGLVGGEKFGTALKNAAIVGGATFVTAGLLEGAYSEGWQDVIHFRNTKEITKVYKQAEQALANGDLQTWSNLAVKLQKLGSTFPQGSVKPFLGKYNVTFAKVENGYTMQTSNKITEIIQGVKIEIPASTTINMSELTQFGSGIWSISSSNPITMTKWIGITNLSGNISEARIIFGKESFFFTSQNNMSDTIIKTSLSDTNNYFMWPFNSE